MEAFLKKHKDRIIYILVILLSVLYIVIGSRIASSDFYFGSISSLEYSAKVTEIVNVDAEEYYIEGASMLYTMEKVLFKAELTSGEMSGRTVEVTQERDSILITMPKRVEVGDDVVVAYSSMPVVDEEGNELGKEFVWTFSEYHRIPTLVWLGLAFFVFLLIFGRKNGFNTIVSLIFTCLAVFMVFVPSILSGYNVYLSAAITCVYIITMTLLIVVGATKKCLCASVGCIGGIAVTAILTLVVSDILHLTGMSDDESVYLMMLEDVQVDLRALLFGAILVGAVGAVMDVSMSLSSSLLEVSEKMGDRRSFKELFRSGMTIGRDIMGTMANTLILAYIGSSLSVVLLMVANESSFLSLFNREMIVEEIMQAIAGSFGILFTIPLTSLFAAWLYTRKAKK